MSSPSPKTLPTLDLNSVLDSADSDSNSSKVATLLEEFLTTEGYVYLINHGIPTETITAAFQTTKAFFDLPNEIKSKYFKPPSVVSYHGYNAKTVQDVTRSQEIVIREYFHVWANPSNRSGNYPNEIQGFQDSIIKLLYSKPSQDLNQILLQLLSKIYRKTNSAIKDDEIDLGLVHEGCKPGSSIKNYSYFSSMFYPSIPEGVEIGDDKRSLRCSAHTDCSTFTLLFFDQVEGLQKKDLKGEWTDIPPLENAILFIPGDFLEAISNGKFPALVHRVPTNMYKRQSRQSLPVYILPDNETPFLPVNSTKTVTFGEYYENLIKDRYFR